MTSPIPNLFLVGCPKTGSSSLQAYLKQHPETFFSHPKELHFFCSDFHHEAETFHGKNNRIFDITRQSDFDRKFEKAGSAKIIAEASTSYMHSRNAAENIFAYNPNAKIIIMLRNPADLLYSWHAYLLFRSEEFEEDFETALSLEIDRKLDWNKIPKSVRYPSRIFYSQLVDFPDQIKRYQSLFPPDQIKIVLTEDLHKDTLGVYRDLLDFLEIDAEFSPDLTRVNVNRAVRFKRIKWLLDNPLDVIKAQWRKLPETAFTKKARAIYFSILAKEQVRSEMDPALRMHILEKQKSIIASTSDLLDRDLLETWK